MHYLQASERATAAWKLEVNELTLVLHMLMLVYHCVNHRKSFPGSYSPTANTAFSHLSKLFLLIFPLLSSFGLVFISCCLADACLAKDGSTDGPSMDHTSGNGNHPLKLPTTNLHNIQCNILSTNYMKLRWLQSHYQKAKMPMSIPLLHLTKSWHSSARFKVIRVLIWKLVS